MFVPLQLWFGQETPGGIRGLLAVQIGWLPIDPGVLALVAGPRCAGPIRSGSARCWVG